MINILVKTWERICIPINALFILHSKRLHPAYRLTVIKRIWLGLRMAWNLRKIPCATSYGTHLAMALKILETPPEIPGCVVECGTWKGGCAANLSLACRIAGRRLLIFDSFAGLPPGKIGDREARHYQTGDYCGSQEEVQSHLSRFGAAECCTLVKGWFEETLPALQEPVLLAFVDVDLEDSLDCCVKTLWPKLVPGGYLFIDEMMGLDYCALFYSEKWWNKHFRCTPPGLIGAGTGLALGNYYIGPWSERADHPWQKICSGAYVQKGMSGYWNYYPDEIDS